MNKRACVAILFILPGLSGFAQDSTEVHTLNYDPDKLKIIPDKVFEFGIPLLFVFLLISAIIAVLKNRAEQELKLKMIEKGISEQALISLFRESNAIARLQPLKWFLFSLFSGLALLVIHFNKAYLVNQSGYFAVGIILLFLSVAFLIYYSVLKK